MAKKNNVKKTVTYEAVITGGPEKQTKLEALSLSLHCRPFKDVTTYTVTDKDGHEAIEKVVIISDSRKKIRNLYAALHKKYTVEVKVLEVVTEKPEPKKKETKSKKK